MAMFKNRKLSDFIEFNPSESLSIGTIAKKIPMEKLTPYRRDISGYEISLYSSGPKFRNEDTLVAKITPCLENGKTAFVNILDSDEVAFGSSEFIVLRAITGQKKEEDNTDPKFLYYLSVSPNFRKRAISCMEGTSGRKRVVEGTLKNHTLLVPDYNEQRQIAAVLSAIDDKIRLNVAINHNLELMAKQLYDYWFVQFDFPNEEGKPYKLNGGKMVWNKDLRREIPDGWEVVELSSYLETYTEKVLPKTIKSNEKYAPIEVLPRRKMSFCECAPIENAVSGLCRFQKKHILLSNRRVYFHKVCIAAFNGLTRDTVIVLNSFSNDNLGYAYQLINDDMFIEYATRHSYGSEQPVLSWESAKKYKVLKPSGQFDVIYSKHIASIIDNVLKNEIEIGSLTKLRDEVLPLLMNGQVLVNYDLLHD